MALSIFLFIITCRKKIEQVTAAATAAAAAAAAGNTFGGGSVPSPNSAKRGSLTRHNVETIMHNLATQAEATEYELNDARKRNMELKVQLEREKMERAKAVQETTHLKELTQHLTNRIKDMEAELNVYKTQLLQSSPLLSPLSSSAVPSVNDAVPVDHAFQEEHNAIKAQILEEQKQQQPEGENGEHLTNGHSARSDDKEEGGENEEDEHVQHHAVFQKLERAQSFIKEMKDTDQSLREQLTRVTSSSSLTALTTLTPPTSPLSSSAAYTRKHSG